MREEISVFWAGLILACAGLVFFIPSVFLFIRHFETDYNNSASFLWAVVLMSSIIVFDLGMIMMAMKGFRP